MNNHNARYRNGLSALAGFWHDRCIEGVQIAESEVNRAHLSMEWQVLADEARGFSDKAKTVAWTSAVALLIVGLTAFRHSRASI